MYPGVYWDPELEWGHIGIPQLYDENILHFYDLFLLGNPDRLSPGFSRDTDQQLIGLS
jgi:hypothetical protein